MKRIEDPIRWLDARSDASDDVRALLSRGRDALGPSKDELTRLGAFAAGAGTGGALGGAGAVGKVAAVRAGSHLAAKAGALKLAAILAVGVGGGVGYSVLHAKSEAPPAVTTVVGASDSVPAVGAARLDEPPAAASPASAAPTVTPAEPPASVAVTHVKTAATATALVTAPAAPGAAPAAAPVAPPATDVPPAAVVVAESPPPAQAPPGESELALLDRARTRVGSDPAGAMRALDEHRARFPNGTFAQEREVLAIETLVRLGRRQEAKARADAFGRAFPTSAHRRRIAVLLGENGGE
jgi:hypothetical protein